MLLYFKKPNEYQKTRQKRVIPKSLGKVLCHI